MTQFKKYPKIYRLGSEETMDFLTFQDDSVVIEEKVDGGNGCFWIDEDKAIHVSSRNRDLTDRKDAKTFAKQRATLMEVLKGKEISDEHYYYIEWMATHTIKYDKAPDIIGLDIRAKRSMLEGEAGMFLGRDTRVRMFEELGIENTPLVWRGKISELKKMNIAELISSSKYYKGKMEGVVLKNYNRKAKVGNHQLYAKVVADEFKENNKAVFGGVREKNTDTNKIVDEYCTDARIKKHIQKLLNEEGLPLGMELMQHLPRGVSQDILQEEITGIFEAYKWLDFKSFKNLITKKCVRVLKEYMLSEAIK